MQIYKKIKRLNCNMGRRKKEIAQLPVENLSDIYDEIKEESKIIGNKSKCVLKKADSESDCDVEKKSEKNKIVLGKLSAVDTVIGMFPELKKDKEKILSNVLTPKPLTMASSIREKTYVLQKVVIDGVSYYRDSHGNVIDNKLNLVGLYTQNDGVYEYMMNNL